MMSSNPMIWWFPVWVFLTGVFTGAREGVLALEPDLVLGFSDVQSKIAAELVAAQKGAGMMIIAASKFQLTDIVLMGIILIGVIGYAIDIIMRRLEDWLVPWKGKG